MVSTSLHAWKTKQIILLTFFLFLCPSYSPPFFNVTWFPHPHITMMKFYLILVLTVTVLNLSIVSLKTIYDKMCGEDRSIREFYSACLVPLQMQLYATMPTKLKSLIRTMKFWKKDTLSVFIPDSSLFYIYIID